MALPSWEAHALSFSRVAGAEGPGPQSLQLPDLCLRAAARSISGDGLALQCPPPHRLERVGRMAAYVAGGGDAGGGDSQQLQSIAVIGRGKVAALLRAIIAMVRLVWRSFRCVDPVVVVLAAAMRCAGLGRLVQPLWRGSDLRGGAVYMVRAAAEHRV